MKRILYLAIFIIAFVVTTQGQVTIGSLDSPNQNALLDLKETIGGTSSKGLLLPRVELSATSPAPLTEHVKGMVVYNLEKSDGTGLPEGYYINTGSGWEKLLGGINWFYMPSITIDVKTDVTGATIDLYQKYVDAFFGSKLIASAGAGQPFTTPIAKDKLAYYVTGYDDTVFLNVSISAQGVLKYDVNSDNVTDATYMNIIFIAK